MLQKQRKNLPLFYGINPETVINGMVVIRPLLDIYKEDILKYNEEHHIPYSLDVTNLENVFLRNRIRNQLLKYSLIYSANKYLFIIYSLNYCPKQ